MAQTGCGWVDVKRSFSSACSARADLRIPTGVISETDGTAGLDKMEDRADQIGDNSVRQ